MLTSSEAQVSLLSFNGCTESLQYANMLHPAAAHDVDPTEHCLYVSLVVNSYTDFNSNIAQRKTHKSDVS